MTFILKFMKKKSRLQKYHFYSTIFHYKSPRSSLKSRKPPHSPMLFFGNGKLWLHPKNIEHSMWKESFRSFLQENSVALCGPPAHSIFMLASLNILFFMGMLDSKRPVSFQPRNSDELHSQYIGQLDLGKELSLSILLDRLCVINHASHLVTNHIFIIKIKPNDRT